MCQYNKTCQTIINIAIMGIIHFFKDVVCLTGFSFASLCVVAALLLVALISIFIGVIAHKPYENNYLCFKSCHAFIFIMQVAWIILFIVLCVESITVVVFAFIDKVNGIEFILRLFVTFLLVAGLIDLAIRIYRSGGVGYISPYEKLLRFAKPCFWEEDPS